MRRKLVFVAVSMTAGIISTYLYNIIAIFIGFLPFIFLCIVFNGSSNVKKRRLAAVVLCAYVLGCLLNICSDSFAERTPLKESVGTNACYTGTIYQIDKKSDDEYRIYCRIMNRRVIIRYYKTIEDYWTLYGRKIRFSTTLEEPSSAGNPRTFDYSLYLKSKGIYFIGTISYYKIERQAVCPWERFKGLIIKKRENFLDLFSCSEEVNGFIRAVLFGDTSNMSDEIYDDFRNNGTAHILAVSGLHVGLLYALYAAIYKRRKKKIYTGAFVFILFIYATAALWSFSVTRAVFLIVIMLFGNIMDRRYDTLTALAFAAIVILLINPKAVFNTGFQMSFIAVASLACISPYIEKWTGRGMSAVIGVQLGLIPYTAYMFNCIPIAAILCNIPVVWMTSIFVPLGIVLFALFFVSNLFFGMGASLFSDLGNLIINLNHILSCDGFFSIEVTSPKLWIVVMVYICIFSLMSEYFQVFIIRKDKKAFVMPLMIILIVFIAAVDNSITPFDAAKVVFVDVGQGDCIHLKCGKGTDVLFDGGGSVNYNIGEKQLKPYLLKNGVADIDLALVTHTHTDHYKGIEELNKCFKVRKTLTGGLAGEIISLPDGSKIRLLWPENYISDIDEADENANCRVFKLLTEDFSVLITGDITEEGEKKLLAKYKGTNMLKADVLKIAHHGSKYSSCTEFIDAVNPKVAVICVGKNNYGHPNNEIIEKFRKKGIMILRTDHSGAVGIINKKRGKIAVCTKKP